MTGMLACISWMRSWSHMGTDWSSSCVGGESYSWRIAPRNHSPIVQRDRIHIWLYQYTEITLLSASGAVFAHLLLECMKPTLLAHRRPQQSGFTPGRSTCDQIATLYSTAQRWQDYGHSTYSTYAYMHCTDLLVWFRMLGSHQAGCMKNWHSPSMVPVEAARCQVVGLPVRFQCRKKYDRKLVGHFSKLSPQLSNSGVALFRHTVRMDCNLDA